MTIDLRKYYLGASETLEWEMDLSEMELGGVKPFCAPVKVRAQLKSFAGSALLTAEHVEEGLTVTDEVELGHEGSL